MTRAEWWTLVILLGYLCFLQTLNFVYNRYIWNDITDMWRWVFDNTRHEWSREWHNDPTPGQRRDSETQEEFWKRTQKPGK